MIRVAPTTQSYSWGKQGVNSKVYQLAQKPLDASKPYAELWMGTHPTSPSHLYGSKELLKSCFTPSKLGKCYNTWGDLPFLFKVLSIETALSIQAHPDKALAAVLFQKYPDVYKDNNHKPEMAIALTPFEAFCGFRHVLEIAEFMLTVPELTDCIGSKLCKQFQDQINLTGDLDDQESVAANKKALRQCFEALQLASQETITKNCQSLKANNRALHELTTKLGGQYPNDVGIFCSFFLNYIVLEKGQGIFLGANQPHAYISGDCVECMAASDNVVRSGLTPKFKDVKTLIEMLTYDYGPIDLVAGKIQGDSVLYTPDVKEFGVVGQTVTSKSKLKRVDGPSIVLVVEGSGKSYESKTGGNEDMVLGSCWFVGAGSDIELSGNMTLYQAYCE